MAIKNMKKITEKAYAKINLHLDITSKYPDGYHGVNTVMQTVSLCDDVSISLNDTGSISLLCDAPGIPCDGKNIAWRAAELFFDRLGLTYGAEIEIVKRMSIKKAINEVQKMNKTPQHYQSTIQPIDLINAQDLNFNLGNVVKYVCRAGKKQGENVLSDLEKAKNYIDYEIERIKKNE